MQINQHSLHFRDAMASLSAAVNIITTQGNAGRCGITATAVCSVTDTPPTVIVCLNAKSAMNPVFQANGKLCINILNHQQEEMARHFAGMTVLTMEERFRLPCWQDGALAQPELKGALASLQGVINQVQTIGTHLVYQVEIKHIVLNQDGQGLMYFKRNFHPVPALKAEIV